MENPKQFIREIEDLIADNRLQVAGEKLLSFFRSLEDEELINRAVLNLGRLKNFLRSSEQLGVVDFFDEEYAKVRLAIVQMKSTAKMLLEKDQRDAIILKPDPKTDSAPLQRSPKIIVDENFKNNDRDWPTEQDHIKSANIQNGRYFIEHFRNEKGWRFTQDIEVDDRKDFTISARMLFLEGTESNGYGLSWGAGEGLNSFSFVVSANGLFNIVYFVDGRRFPICEWEKNPAIRKGNAINILEIVKMGDIIHYKVNEEVVFTAPFISFFGNKFGFVLYQNMKVAVDYYRISN